MATSCNCPVFNQFLKLLILLLLAIELALPNCTACYTSLFSFGDSYADTGNYYYYSSETHSNHCFHLPYGETYFRHPSGRCSNGRLVVDFLAESLGFPLLKPYLGIKNGKLENINIEQGVNFAVIGATALDRSFFRQRSIRIPTNLSLNVQLQWFKELLPTICSSFSSCRRLLGKSLFVVGEIGCNDIYYASSQGKSIEEIKAYIPYLINATTSAISELIDLGAVTLVVPGVIPVGCMPVFLTLYRTTYKEEYDEAGCLKWLNDFAYYYNQELQASLDKLRLFHPHTAITYADYFNVAWDLYHTPKQFGLTGPALKACCGGGGPYNFNSSAICGLSGAVPCDDPSNYVAWDGIHLTEASYSWIAKGIIDGPYANPKINVSCLSRKMSPTNVNLYPWK